MHEATRGSNGLIRACTFQRASWTPEPFLERRVVDEALGDELAGYWTQVDASLTAVSVEVHKAAKRERGEAETEVDFDVNRLGENCDLELNEVGEDVIDAEAPVMGLGVEVGKVEMVEEKVGEEVAPNEGSTKVDSEGEKKQEAEKKEEAADAKMAEVEEEVADSEEEVAASEVNSPKKKCYKK